MQCRQPLSPWETILLSWTPKMAMASSGLEVPIISRWSGKCLLLSWKLSQTKCLLLCEVLTGAGLARSWQLKSGRIRTNAQTFHIHLLIKKNLLFLVCFWVIIWTRVLLMFKIWRPFAKTRDSFQVCVPKIRFMVGANIYGGNFRSVEHSVRNVEFNPS